ncbi:hypothetical protein [Rouxiella sp. WC2420]|uniref:Uncharacterized protein n=1 Tax=Rouxiella sp. WC2420 TaxID=3234145 RepID=A0AB39VX19_9GAMM
MVDKLLTLFAHLMTKQHLAPVRRFTIRLRRGWVQRLIRNHRTVFSQLSEMPAGIGIIKNKRDTLVAVTIRFNGIERFGSVF